MLKTLSLVLPLLLITSSVPSLLSFSKAITRYLCRWKWIVGSLFSLPPGIFPLSFRLLRMETWRRWRRRSAWRNTSGRDVRTRDPPVGTVAAAVATAGRRRPRRNADDRPSRNCPRIPQNSPSRWTPSWTPSSITEMGEEGLCIYWFICCCCCCFVSWHGKQSLMKYESPFCCSSVWLRF